MCSAYYLQCPSVKTGTLYSPFRAKLLKVVRQTICEIEGACDDSIPFKVSVLYDVPL